MMRIGLFFVCITLFFSCSESPREKRVYTEKDIEGYWATNSVIQNSELTAALANNCSQKSQHTLLRFYNDVCGLPDTIYKVSGDTIFLLEYELAVRKWVFKAAYLINFVSEERLILREVGSGSVFTYYSLTVLPQGFDEFSSIDCVPHRGGEGIRLTADSLTYSFVRSCFDTHSYYRHKKSSPVFLDAEWVRRINTLYSRLTKEDILFARPKQKKPVLIEGEFILYDPEPPCYTLELNGTRGREIVGCASNVVNPVIRAIYLELTAITARQDRLSAFMP